MDEVRLYQFHPQDDITAFELCGIEPWVNTTISGQAYDLFADNLKRHFKEIDMDDATRKQVATMNKFIGIFGG